MMVLVATLQPILPKIWLTHWWKLSKAFKELMLHSRHPELQLISSLVYLIEETPIWHFSNLLTLLSGQVT